ncbi:hypothetical protein [Actinomadura physcomitrii]|nr:hypothetical protein [Actinomadura physcomitrii]
MVRMLLGLIVYAFCGYRNSVENRGPGTVRTTPHGGDERSSS